MIISRCLLNFFKGGEQFLSKLHKGDFFGERALEDAEGKRTANIIANAGEDGGKKNFVFLCNI